MRRLQMGLIAAALSLTGGAAFAQGCSSRPVASKEIAVTAVTLYDMQAKYVRHALTASLPAMVPAFDCGDATFVVFELEKQRYLVRKSEISAAAKCVCMPMALRPKTAGAPGGGEPLYCPEAQCRGR